MAFDITKLMVGQDVYMICGPYHGWGKVVKVTPDCVEVLEETLSGRNQPLLHFNKNGQGRDNEGSECGPWQLELDDAGLRRVKAWYEQRRAKDKR